MTTETKVARGASLRVKGGRSAAPSVSQGRLAALARSVWAPIVAKLALAVVALGGLAALGGSAIARPSPPLGAVPSAASPEAPPPAAAPAIAAITPDAGAATDAAPAVTMPGTLPDGRIVLNAAAEEDLTKLPSVGPKRARAILALRQRLGRFRAIEDLLRVKGIGRKTLVRIRPRVVLDPPPIADGGSSVGHL